MPKLKSRLTAADIMKEIKIDQFLNSSTPERKKELDNIVSYMKDALQSMESDPTNHTLHMEKVHTFLSGLWEKYDSQDIIEILDNLTRVEPPLMDFGRNGVEVYRDHYVHIFNVYILGLRILSKVIEKAGNNAKKLLKVNDEHINNIIPAFHDYEWKERLFYLWTLIATFHDISIPITRLNTVNDSLNKFLGKFGLQAMGPSLVPIFPSDVEDFYDALSRIYEGQIKAVDDWSYERSRQNHYVHSVLRSEFRRSNHGVLSAFLMYTKTRDIFLEGKNKRPLEMDLYNKWIEYVLKQDIARAALAISLHDLAPSHDDRMYPRCIPVDFKKYPLTCLLIITDCMQEYFRWEGTSIVGGSKFLSFPQLDVVMSGNSRRIEFFLTMGTKGEGEYLLERINALKKIQNQPPVDTVGKAAADVCDRICDELSTKIKKGSVPVKLNVKDKKDQVVYSKSIHL